MNRLVPVLASVVIVGTLVALCFRAFSDPVPVERLKRLQQGMSQDEVRSIIGQPARIYQSGQWTYERRLVFGFVNIHWREDGTYDGEFVFERF